MLPNKHKVIRKPVSSFLDSSTTSSLKYFEATSTGNDNVRSANANWQLNIHGHLSTLIFMLQPMQVTILLPATIWSAFVQLTLTQYGPTLTVVRNNSGQQSYGCNLSLIIFPWSKCSLRSDSYKFGIILSASLVAVIIVEVAVDNFNPEKFFNARLWDSCVLHSSIESIKPPRTVRRMLPLQSYKIA